MNARVGLGALAIAGAVAVYLFGPLVWEPARAQADRECSQRMDSFGSYSTNWEITPTPHWRCVTTEEGGESVRLGWWP